MTTVGYGDITPVTPLGQSLASLIMIMGYGIIAVPTGIVTLELNEANRRQANTRTGSDCAAEGHSREASYCWRCGAALYQRCRFFVGSDSGPMHLAAATGAPVFALFGPSDEAIWAPLGEHSHPLRGTLCCADDCDAFHCRLDYRCMASLHPEAVMEAINDRLPSLSVETQ